MYPDVTDSSLVVSSDSAFLEDYPLTSSFFGLGYNHAKLATSQTSVAMTFDLGTGNTRLIDHLIIGGVKSLLTSGVTGVYVQGSSNGSSWTSLMGTTSGFQTRTKDGPYSDSIIFTASYNDQIAGAISAYRYFKVIISGASPAAQLAFKKLYFGAAFDIGEEPSTYNLEVSAEDDSDTWKYPRGHTIMSKAFYPKHKVTVEWDGVSDSKANEFVNKILKDPYRNTVYLYTATHKDPLYNNTLMHCRVVADQCRITKPNDVLDWNDIVAVFEEV
jgi:hypothetical protein